MNSLDGIRVLDLSRVLAGPWCTQTLADLGADVIKIERPGTGDDTRTWGPPFLKDAQGQDTAEAAYYLGANRNKRSVTCDIAQPEGQALIRELVKHCDVFVENFKVGDMARYGLDYTSLSALNPKLVYCSVTGFGQTGPYRERAGYDYAVQGIGGLMSVTGERDDLGGGPQKVGVAVADLFTGMYATVAILAALRHVERTGQGQQVDMALLDTQVAMLANLGSNYLVSGKVPGRAGNAHQNIVPRRTLRAERRPGSPPRHPGAAAGGHPQNPHQGQLAGGPRSRQGALWGDQYPERGLCGPANPGPRHGAGLATPDQTRPEAGGQPDQDEPHPCSPGFATPHVGPTHRRSFDRSAGLDH